MAEEKKKRSRSLIKNAGGLAITRLGQFKIKAQALTSKPYALVLISVDAPYHKDETILTNFFANLDSLFGNENKAKDIFEDYRVITAGVLQRFNYLNQGHSESESLQQGVTREEEWISKWVVGTQLTTADRIERWRDLIGIDMKVNGVSEVVFNDVFVNQLAFVKKQFEGNQPFQAEVKIAIDLIFTKQTDGKKINVRRSTARKNIKEYILEELAGFMVLTEKYPNAAILYPDSPISTKIFGCYEIIAPKDKKLCYLPITIPVAAKSSKKQNTYEAVTDSLEASAMVTSAAAPSKHVLPSANNKATVTILSVATPSFKWFSAAMESIADVAIKNGKDLDEVYASAMRALPSFNWFSAAVESIVDVAIKNGKDLDEVYASAMRAFPSFKWFSAAMESIVDVAIKNGKGLDEVYASAIRAFPSFKWFSAAMGSIADAAIKNGKGLDEVYASAMKAFISLGVQSEASYVTSSDSSDSDTEGQPALAAANH